jgi:hypothetical protein
MARMRYHIVADTSGVLASGSGIIQPIASGSVHKNPWGKNEKMSLYGHEEAPSF